MIRVGVIGLGMMGLTHLDVYSQRDDVKVVAISDRLPDRLSGRSRAEGNVEGQAKGTFDHSSARQYSEGRDLIADREIDLIDICLTTPDHLEYGKLVLDSGRHLMVEKPLARTASEAFALAEAAEKSDRMSFCGMCMRFWPGWTWLKRAVEEERYGRVLAAHFRRVASHPDRPFYSSGELSGGAILDLHIHDTDFVQYLFGVPDEVYSTGYAKITDRPDHVITHYRYGDKSSPALVIAEGGWAMAKGFGFQMQFNVNFERATATFDISRKNPLMLYEPDVEPHPVEVEPGMGYEHEIDYMLRCIQENRRPQAVTLRDAAMAVRIVEAEAESLRRGAAVRVERR
jgi:predicted dehydrogenase